MKMTEPLRSFGQLTMFVISLTSAIAGVLIWIAGISTKSDLAMAKAENNADRLERQGAQIRNQNDILMSIKEDTAATKAKVDLLLKK